MAQLDKLILKNKFNDLVTGLYRPGQIEGIDSSDHRTLVTDFSDSVLFFEDMATGTGFPKTLGGGSSLFLDGNNAVRGLFELDTALSSVTVTFQNLKQGAEYFLHVRKQVAGNLTINLNHVTLSFVNYKTGATSNIVLSGAANREFLLRFSNMGTIAPPVGIYILDMTDVGSGAGLGGSTGSIDNAVLRADGVGGSTLQSSNLIIEDNGNMDLSGLSNSFQMLVADGFLQMQTTKATSGADAQWFIKAANGIGGAPAGQHIFIQGGNGATGGNGGNVNLLAGAKNGAAIDGRVYVGISGGPQWELLSGTIWNAPSNAQIRNTDSLTISSGVLDIIGWSGTSGSGNGGRINIFGGNAGPLGLDGGSLFIDPGLKSLGNDGNLGIFLQSVANWKGMGKGMAIGNVTSPPTAAPDVGVFLYSQGGRLKIWEAGAGSPFVIGSGGGGVITASNGLTKVGNDVKLGGLLKEDTNIIDSDGTGLSISNLAGTKDIILVSSDDAGFSGNVAGFFSTLSETGLSSNNTTNFSTLTVTPTSIFFETSFIILSNLPTSCAGAPTGALANIGGVLTICP